MKPDCLLIIPTASDIHAQTTAVVTRLALQGEVDFVPIIARPVDYARNCGLRFWRDHRPHCRHLLFLDSDVVPPLDVVQRLTALNVPVATGCYPVYTSAGKRWAVADATDPDDPFKLAMRPQLPTDGLPFLVDACGGGCLMLRRDVLERVPAPWFQWGQDADGTLHGEDYFFCHQCHQAGIDITCDPTVICKHFRAIDLATLPDGLTPVTQE